VQHGPDIPYNPLTNKPKGYQTEQCSSDKFAKGPVSITSFFNPSRLWQQFINNVEVEEKMKEPKRKYRTSNVLGG
jgi:hypothetical protein